MHRRIGLMVLLAAATTPLAVTAADRPPIVAVLDVEPVGVKLSGPTIERLTAFLTGRLAATSTLQVVPRAQVKAKLIELKRESNSDCYAGGCQIPLGEAVSAQKTVTTQVVMAGAGCTVNVSVFDVRRETSDGGASVDGSCDEAGIVESLKAAIGEVVVVATGLAVRAAEEEVAECPAGREVSPDTAGHCCWPGQAWNGKNCVGRPTTCPEGHEIAIESCELVFCADGRVRPDGVHCCWPRQAWSPTRKICMGVAACPEGTLAQDDGCTADPEILALHATTERTRRLGEAWTGALAAAEDRRLDRTRRIEILEGFLREFPEDNPFGDDARRLLEQIRTGRLVVISLPEDASLALDGLKVGRAPFNGLLEPGLHEVKLSSSGYLAATQTVEVFAEDVTNLRVNLRKIPMNPYNRWGHGLFWSGLAVAGALGGAFTGTWVQGADDYRHGDRSKWGWANMSRDLAISFWTVGGAMMISGVVCWSLSPGDKTWAEKHGVTAGVGPATGGQGGVLMVSCVW